MDGTVAAAAAQIHFWPWSVEVPEETMDLTGGTVRFPFFGSPVISLVQGATLLLTSRMEHFRPLGPPYPSLDSTCQVYETPHGVLAGPADLKKLRLLTRWESQEIFFTAEGAAERFRPSGETTQQGDSPIARHVLAWSQVFDDLLEQASKPGGHSNEVAWSEVLGQLRPLSEPNEPRMALIVRIAQQMRRRLPDNVSSMRRILLRERELVPLHRIQETDSTCLRWYARQPGSTTPEKAGPTQRLLAVVRKESCDTLENRILKDFVLRCRQEATRYLDGEVGDSPRLQASARAREVRSYKSVCNMCVADPVFEPINLPTPGTPPNYVLQNDLRYREVWNFYKRLLKREREEDQIWDWQPRTWADIMRLFVGAALELGRMARGAWPGMSNGVVSEQLASSLLRLTSEQHLGGRIIPGSEAGPFHLTRVMHGRPGAQAVMEVVHPDLATQHSVVRLLGRTGGHLYLVIHPLGRTDSRKTVLILWSVNGAGIVQAPAWDAIAHSAWKALQRHNTVLSSRRTGFPELKGMVVVSRLESLRAIFRGGNGDRLPVLEAPSDPSGWESAVEELALGLEAIFGEML